MPYAGGRRVAAMAGLLADSLGDLPPAVVVWQAQVRARGNVPTRMPKGPNVGKLAERYVDQQGAYRYALASDAALKADAGVADGYASDIAAGARVQAIQDGAAAVVQGTLAAPRNIIGGVLGIPPNAVGLIALGVAGFVGFRLLESVAPRRNPPRRARRQPRGRR
jgi:hypothetical protein